MPRPKKDAKVLTIKMATPIYDSLDRFCDESGQNKTLAVERAVAAYIEEYDRKQELLKEIDGRQ